MVGEDDSERKMKRFKINVEVGKLDFQVVFVADSLPLANLQVAIFDELIRPHYRTELEEITD